MKTVFFIVVVIVAWVAISGFMKKDSWQLSYELADNVYPQTYAVYDNPAECIQNVKIAEILKPAGYNFECGLNCELSKSGIVYYCDETI